MRITKLTMIVALGTLAVLASACGSSPAQTPLATRAATQTPWIIYVPVTSTPEPAIVTPLPTVTPSQPTKTPTKAAPTKGAATKVPPTAVPVVAAPSATPAPACSLGSVNLIFPEDGSQRRTRRTGPGSDTFVFTWSPFQSGETDPQVGYRIEIESKKGNAHVNGDTAYVSHNEFLRNGGKWIYNAQRVYGLASATGGDDVVVNWKVTVVKIGGSYNWDQGTASGTVTTCGSPSSTWKIQLIVIDL